MQDHYEVTPKTTPATNGEDGYETVGGAPKPHRSPMDVDWQGPRLKISGSTLHVQLPNRNPSGSSHRAYGSVVDYNLGGGGIGIDSEEAANLIDAFRTAPIVKSLATAKRIYAPCVVRINGDTDTVVGLTLVDNDGSKTDVSVDLPA